MQERVSDLKNGTISIIVEHDSFVGVSVHPQVMY